MSSEDQVHFSGTVAVISAEDFPHAMRRLQASFSGIDWHSEPSGSSVSAPTIALTTDASLVEGAFTITPSNTGSMPRIEIAGGSVSGVIYAIEELIAQGGTDTRNLQISSKPQRQEPGLAYRTFWTWDHSSNWELSQIGHQEIGVFNPYGKPPGGFLADYQRMVDYCSQHRIAAIVIYGFLRDTHGGIEAARSLCRYANERGVRIIPGVAIGSYGGVYWEGDHPYNLASWLGAHPAHAATLEKGVGFQLEDLAFALNFPKSDYTLSACPSAPETIAWMTDAVSWLAETFEIGGINIESGDYGVCGCQRCVTRRADREVAQRRAADTGESWSHSDMADNFPPLFAAANAKRKDLWMYCELQWDNLLDPTAHKALEGIPSGGIYQHTSNKSYWSTMREQLTRDYTLQLPTQPNVLRCQFACQWNGDERTERYALNAKTFCDMAQKAHEFGMQGLTVWGEPSPYHVSVELSYLAFARFSYEPTLTWQQFVENDVAPLLGGHELATRFIELQERLDANQFMAVETLDHMQAQALDIAKGLSDEPMRRWLTLIDAIGRRRYMGK